MKKCSIGIILSVMTVFAIALASCERMVMCGADPTYYKHPVRPPQLYNEEYISIGTLKAEYCKTVDGDTLRLSGYIVQEELEAYPGTYKYLFALYPDSVIAYIDYLLGKGYRRMSAEEKNIYSYLCDISYKLEMQAKENGCKTEELSIYHEVDLRLCPALPLSIHGVSSTEPILDTNSQCRLYKSIRANINAIIHFSYPSAGWERKMGDGCPEVSKLELIEDINDIISASERSCQ